MTSPSSEPVNISPTRLAIYVAVVFFSTAVLCPLEVIATRISLQRNYSGSAEPVDTLPQAESGDADVNGVQYSGQEEDVIGLRSEDDPYTGLIDCGKRIIKEEGVGVLYRAWWLTFLFSFTGAFV